MANDWDDQLDTGEQEYSLDEILEEIASSRKREEGFVVPSIPTQPWEEPAAPDLLLSVVKKPEPKPEERPAPASPAPRSEKHSTPKKIPRTERHPAPKPTAPPVEERHVSERSVPTDPEPPTAEKALPAAPEKPHGEPKPKRIQENVIQFPDGDAQEKTPGLLSGLMSRLLRQADDYAEHMFEEEEPDQEALRAEKLLPGVDVEQPTLQRKSHVPRPRRVRTWPDTPPQELASEYGKGLGSLRIRRYLVFLLALPLLLLSLIGSDAQPFLAILADRTILVWICAGVLAAALLLSFDLVKDSLTRLGPETLILLSCAATLADAIAMNTVWPREGDLPYSLICVLALGFGLWGRYKKRLGQRTSCRAAVGAKEPYAVTLDEEKWDGRAAFAKWPGTVKDFGSQIQSEDGVMRALRPVAALLILAGLLFALIASVSRGRKELFLWCLSAIWCAGASFSGTLAFALPFCKQARRLAGVGAALAGWEGIRRQARKSGILLMDIDLFPPGAVALNGIKIFQNYPMATVVAYTATLIRDMGSGLERPFHDLLRSQGALYRTAKDLRCYEGGASAVIREDNVLVGSASFMRLMEVELPQGLNVKNAVFCAIEGELAGIFALNYALHSTVRPALSALISNKISPILATRDFNLIPSMLEQRFKLPVDKVDFPEHSRRRELSDPNQKHDLPLVCLLSREGIGPLSEAVVGAKRLHLATRLNTVLSAAGSVIGVLLAFYLTAQAAFASLSVLNLLVFLLMWLIPILLVSGWVNRY